MGPIEFRQKLAENATGSTHTMKIGTLGTAQERAMDLLTACGTASRAAQRSDTFNCNVLTRNALISTLPLIGTVERGGRALAAVYGQDSWNAPVKPRTLLLGTTKHGETSHNKRLSTLIHAVPAFAAPHAEIAVYHRTRKGLPLQPRLCQSHVSRLPPPPCCFTLCTTAPETAPPAPSLPPPPSSPPNTAPIPSTPQPTKRAA